MQLETSSGFSENNQILRNSNSRFVCLQAVSSTSPIYGMEARSKELCNRSNAAGLKKMFAFAFPPFSLIAWVINKVLQKSVETMILVTPT